VLVPFEPHPRHGRRCAGRRGHDGRVILRGMHRISYYYRLLLVTFSPGS
jgi:hypothetical protein